MIREGGKTAPKRVPIKLSQNDIHVCWVESVKRNKYRKYSEHDDAWKRGFVKNPAFYGNVGETAFLYWLQRFLRITQGVDFDLKPKGDKGIDFVLFGRSYQIKAIANERQLSSEICYVRHSDRGRLFPLAAEVYVFFDASDCRTPKTIGTIGREKIRSMPIIESHVPTATHHNYVIPFCELECMATLKEQILLDRRSRATSLSRV